VQRAVTAKYSRSLLLTASAMALAHGDRVAGERKVGRESKG